MKRLLLFYSLCVCLLITSGCTIQKNAEDTRDKEHTEVEISSNEVPDRTQEPQEQASKTDIEDSAEESEHMLSMKVIINNHAFSASLYENETTRAFLKRLPMTLSMDDLHGNEKYSYVTEAFPTAAQPVSQIQTGDIKVFGNDCLVLFYKDFTTSYSYTSLGRIDDPQGLIDVLGTGSVSIRFEQD